MVRTIEVVYTNKYLESNIICQLDLKKYRFLCTNDDVHIGTMITDSRYSTAMQVVNTINKSDVIQNGISLKVIQISAMSNQHIKIGSDFDIDTTARTIAITIEQAREWYNSGNTTLKTLALSAYTEKELELNFDYISNKVCTCSTTINVPTEIAAKTVVNAKLAIIAKYFNGSWSKVVNNTGYFIAKLGCCNNTIKKLDNGFGIIKHESVMYPGLVYFKNPTDAEKAFKLLKTDLVSVY